MIFGIDIGGTNVRSGLVTRDGKLSELRVDKTELVFRNNTGSFLSYLKDRLSGLSQKPDAICAGFPAPVDSINGLVYTTPNIPDFNNIPVANILQNDLQIRTFVTRDVNNLMFYDIAKNSLPRKGIILGFYIGTGLGNGIVIDGKILYGKHGVAGELGHIPTIGIQGHCGCGNDGCFELRASGKYLRELTGKVFPNTDIEDVFTNHVNTLEIEQYIDWLSMPLATEITIFDPDFVIIGGGVPGMKNFPLDKLKEAVYTHTRKPYPAEDISYVISETKHENGVIGAGFYGFDRLDSKNFSY